jgi:ribosomal protein S18 acetylase RimI-like enzyme
MPQPQSGIEVSAAVAASPEVVAAFAQLLPQLSSSAVALTVQDLQDIISAACNTVFLARDTTAGNRIVGTLTLVIFRIPTAVRAWIEDVVVDQTGRGRGIGEALVQEAVKFAAERGAKTIDLTSRPSRAAAHRLYQKTGFHVRDTSVYRFGPRPT